MTYTTGLILWLAGSLALAGLLSLFLERDELDDNVGHSDDHLLNDFHDLK